MKIFLPILEKTICTVYIKKIHFICKFSLVWFLSEAAFSAGSKSAARLRMNFNRQNWSVRWCGSWTPRHSDTQAERNLSLSFFLSLLQNTEPNPSFQLRPLMTNDSVSWQFITLSQSIYLLFFVKFGVAWSFFPLMPSRYLHAAWPFPNGRTCKINDRRSGNHVQGRVSKLTVTAVNTSELRKTGYKDNPVSDNSIHNATASVG